MLHSFDNINMACAASANAAASMLDIDAVVHGDLQHMLAHAAHEIPLFLLGAG